jgi:hypothetical protein
VLEEFSLVEGMIYDLLLESGFCDDLFFIKVEWNKVIVMFDMKEAVDYFRSDFEWSKLSSNYEYAYKQDGKRHCAVITRRRY